MTPVERAEYAVVEAMIDHGPDGHVDGYEIITRAALTAALNVDELAAVIDLHREQYDGDCGMYYGCHCGWDNDTDMHNNGYIEHVARAVVAHLTKGDENDE